MSSQQTILGDILQNLRLSPRSKEFCQKNERSILHKGNCVAAQTGSAIRSERRAPTWLNSDLSFRSFSRPAALLMIRKYKVLYLLHQGESIYEIIRAEMSEALVLQTLSSGQRSEVFSKLEDADCHRH